MGTFDESERGDVVQRGAAETAGRSVRVRACKAPCHRGEHKKHGTEKENSVASIRSRTQKTRRKIAPDMMTLSNV